MLEPSAQMNEPLAQMNNSGEIRMHTLLKAMTTLTWTMAAMLCASVYAECNTNIQSTTPTSRFVVSGDGASLQDTHTQLIWMRCSLGQQWNATLATCEETTQAADRYTFSEALEAAGSSEFLGATDWRLPNKKELASIIDFKCAEPAANQNLFPATKSEAYWTSTPLVYASNFSAWAISFSTGSFTNGSLTDRFAVRLVRDAEW